MTDAVGCSVCNRILLAEHGPTCADCLEAQRATATGNAPSSGDNAPSSGDSAAGSEGNGEDQGDGADGKAPKGKADR